MVFLLTISAKAQESKIDYSYLKKGYLGMSFGVGLPVLEFASKDYGTPSAGYALPGYQWRIFAGYNVLPYLNVRVSYINNKNDADVGELLIDSRINGAFGSGPYAYLENITTGKYEVDGVLLGVGYPFKTAKTTMEVYFNIGLANTILPETKYYFEQFQGRKVNLVIPILTSHDFMYTSGVQLSHRIYKNILLCGTLDFLYSEQKYTNVRFYNASNGNTWSLPDYTQYYHIINANIGIAVEFD